MAEFEVERVGGELKRFGVEGSDVPFKVVSPYEPAGSQPKAIESLVRGVRDGDRYQVLLGVTGSGKTFTMAKTIEALGKPTLVMAPNKTLAAQLASELKEFFPNNAVVYFVSYYDYYQPEAYVPQSDTYIEKDSSINEEVEMLRHQATASLLSRRDVIVVASVSCIYGIGSPEDYAGLAPNVAHLGDRIVETLGDGSAWGVRLRYSVEGRTAGEALETLGGIAKALPMLDDGDGAFIVVAGDIVTDFDYSRLVRAGRALAGSDAVAHLVLAPNPSYHADGDMTLDELGLVRREPRTHTFSSLGVYGTSLFEGVVPVRAKLFPWLWQFCEAGRVTGEVYEGMWFNVGDVRELALAEARIRNQMEK